MMYWKGCGMKQPLSIVWYYSSIRLEALSKFTRRLQG